MSRRRTGAGRRRSTSTPSPGRDYLIRVAPLANSVADSFTLRVVVPDEPANPPGQQLAGNGVNAFVDRFANPDDAWAVRLREGRTYRINFVTSSSGCAQLSLFPAGTSSSESPVRTMTCDAHTVFTPPERGSTACSYGRRVPRGRG